jgi:transmembrane sensor
MSTNINIDKSNPEFDQFLDMLGSAQIPEGRSKEEAWDLLMKNIEQSEQKAETKVHRLPIRAIISIAATLVFLLGGWYTYNVTKTETFTAGNGQIATVELPDKSVVQLNAGSSISFKTHGFMEHRNIELHGEAFFKVKKGNEFVVQSNESKVTVLGTSFNIYARNNRFNVKCYTGKVRVESPSILPVILTRGKSVKTIANSALCDTALFNAEETVKWTIGEFYFNNESLNTVFEEMERQFDVTISIPTITERSYTGFFSKSNLKTALDNVCLPMGIKYKIIDAKHIELVEK